MSEASPVAAATPVTPPAAPSARRRALGVIALLVVLGGAAWATAWALLWRQTETTDNAYVQGHVVQITPQIAGTVVAIHADETDLAQAGSTLVELDPADADVALAQAEAQLGQTVREVRALFANNEVVAAQVALREAEAARAQAEVTRAQAELARAEDDLARRVPLADSGAVSREDVAHATAQASAARSTLASAQSTLAAARSALVATREQLAAARTMTDGTRVEDHPSVQRAAGRLREVFLARRRSTLPAPITGVVAKRAVQVGQRVAAGAPLMTLVALDALWVDANFKEGQLDRIRIGQPARLTADVYGAKVEYHGRVAGLGAGTGAAFALLPAQNATGNWIKIVQRVPVRIALDAADLAAHPLRLGLSMEVRVDVSDRSGPALAPVPRSQPVAQTGVFDPATRDADALVQRVVAANLGGRTGATARR